MSIESQARESSSEKYKKNCTLVIPGLLSQLYEKHSPEDPGVGCGNTSQLKELEVFLAKSKQQLHSLVGFEEELFDLFDVASSAGQANPIAPVCYLADADTIADSRAMSWCLRADPVYLAPDRDELVLSGPEVLSLSMSEAEHLATELNILFEEDGWHLEAITATRWYLHLPEDPQINTSDLSQVRGQSINRFLPSGAEGKQWHRILNEVQMVLHASEVNIERQSHGQLSVSSLWFWGGGKLPEFGHSCWSQVWSSDVLSRGLAKVTRTPCLPVPKNSKAWLSQVNAPGEHLIVCDDFISLQNERERNDSDAWCRALQKFESEWLAPLMEALRNGELDELTLNPCDGRTFSLTKNRLKYWWRRRRPIQSYWE
ncbi:MAG: hypothetical protein KAU29_04135 [Gammaproteobacteria bacterium]|nr:hypothetical protein [Gammaproteobacteria bacterium]